MRGSGYGIRDSGVPEVASGGANGYNAPVMRLGRLIPLVLALSMVLGHGVCGANTVADIVARCPDRARSYAEMMRAFTALEGTGRVRVVNIGTSAQGRPIPLVAVFHPQTAFGSGARLFIVARQHGTESVSTETCIAIAQHFAQSQDPQDLEILRKLTFAMVPMANPDGAANSRRGNGNGVDLNRNWSTCSQPETAAIERAVRAWRPDALMDLHELPAGAPKPSYRDNFMECVGQSSGLPPWLCTVSATVSRAMTRAMARCGFPLNVYYDFPGEAGDLCHKHFGLREGIPSFLCEAKTGGGRSLSYRLGFQTMAVMVVAASLINGVMPDTGFAPPLLVADAATAASPTREPVASAPATEPAVAAPEPAKKTTLRVSLPEALKPPASGRVEIAAEVECGTDFSYVSFLVDGQVRALTNQAPYVYSLNAKGLGEGRHALCVQAVDTRGNVLDQRACTLVVDGAQAAGE